MITAYQFISDMAEYIQMPEVYLDVRRLIKKQYARITDFVGIIETDSMLSDRVIRMANSDFFGFPRKTENLFQAIEMIGVKQLHDLVLSSLCLRTFSSIPEEILNLKAFWHYGVQCGIAASTIARHSSNPSSNHFFTLGLLHEVGHPVMYLKSPELCIQVLEDSQTQGCTITDLERVHFGFDYGQLGVAVMQLWKLPEVYQQVAAHHLQPQQADTDYRQDVRIIHLAHAVCQNPVAAQQREIISSLTEDNPELSNLPANIDTLIQAEIDDHADSILSILWPRRAQPLAQVRSKRQ
jgi:HD-like signal output (HDOD) protein